MHIAYRSTLLLGAALCACTSDDHTPLAVALDGGGTATDAQPASDAAAAVDGAGVDGGDLEDIPKVHTVKLANFSEESAINACLRPQRSTDPYIGPIFRAEGIPKGAISARVIIALPSSAEAKIIRAGADCETGEALVIQPVVDASQAQGGHFGVYYRGPGNHEVSGGWIENLVPTPGKDALQYQPPIRADGTFLRDDGVGGAVNLRTPKGLAVLVDGNVTGTISLTSPFTGSRTVRTVAGGTVSVWLSDSVIMLCDERLRSQNGLTRCESTLRAP